MDDDIDIGKILWWVFWIGLALGLIIFVWVTLLGPLFNQADYNNFNTSPTHINAVAQKFSDDCLQLASTTDPQSRKAIENDIYSEAATVDMSKIVLTDNIRTCVNRAIRDVTNTP
jgi:hypothetical protein